DNRHQPTTKHHQIRVIARFEEKVLAYPPAQVARVTPGIIVAGWEFDIRKYQRECKPALGKRAVAFLQSVVVEGPKSITCRKMQRLVSCNRLLPHAINSQQKHYNQEQSDQSDPKPWT